MVLAVVELNFLGLFKLHAPKFLNNLAIREQRLVNNGSDVLVVEPVEIHGRVTYADNHVEWVLVIGEIEFRYIVLVVGLLWKVLNWVFVDEVYLLGANKEDE